MQRTIRIVLLLLFSCSVLACEVEESLILNADGSGTYRAKVSIEKEFGEALSNLRSEVDKKGYRVVEEGETKTHRFVVLARDFKDVAELNDDEDTYALQIDRPSPVKGVYRLTLTFDGNATESGFERRTRVTMPAAVKQASVGQVSGRSVEWDSSHGGTMSIEASGFVVPLTKKQRWLALGVMAIGVVAIAALRLRRRATGPRCAKCGRGVAAEARFCPSCGASHEADLPAS